MKQPLPLLWWLKFILTLSALMFGVLYTLPTFLNHSSSSPANTSSVQESLVSFLPSSQINLGLDLKGGISLTLNVEVHEAVKDALNRSLTRARENLLLKSIKIKDFRIGDDLSVVVKAENSQDTASIQKEILDQSQLLLFGQNEGSQTTFTVNKARLKDFEKQVMQQAMTTIRNRIDQFGVAEPNVFIAGQSRVVIELPGMTDMEHAKELLGNTAKLDFRLVLNGKSQQEMALLLENAKKALQLPESDMSPKSIEKCAQWLRDNNKTPGQSTLLLTRIYETSVKLSQTVPYLVEANSPLTGDLIEDAQAVQSSENYVPQYVVSLKFKPQGAKIFGELTTAAYKPENAPHQIAIVLDGNIQSAPVVNGPILGGNAQITMGRHGQLERQMKDAQDLALVLRAGALPATVNVVEERQIGPSEGAQNIKAGLISTLIAALLVIVLMVAIYGVAGIVANVAMILNVLLILAFMALFGATLTLPGIAGIVLTMAIAVDGNVVINERIREEIRSGLGQKQSFYKGYRTSFRTLIDAHITSAVAGIVLVIYGNPTVKGFAVTLLCGIICTLFTSYYVTEVIGQWLIEKTNFKRFG